ncbi:hypothetical protein, partial [Klebsiella aerogenes]|uniref:hypothetical protein n=1 Tax=Klebsiella aerogenes TaxID=548 RepID=UPI001D0D0CE5
ADRNRSHWSTSKTPSYTKSVSWQHHLLSAAFSLKFRQLIHENFSYHFHFIEKSDVFFPEAVTAKRKNVYLSLDIP